ncbi:MAG: regulatory iron-sulfur-containing complex subunit RicT [Patescibacteria group bacterium]|nr:stage 0 sporulation protein [Patescibacteria group bacterium]MBU1160352.1 stage 0 sporulation protein [Patescibacteria group bacterium]MBU1684202.1 stage 0 sporulation protein [Patescibacteria group bacterium]MBU1778505.1 stage 0 sporulation protein [Patescibacteria group bacterium]MBU1987252.1 stage 0 sporulation protein [Patescibacteria group bacterium]
MRYALCVMRVAQIQFAPWDKIYLFNSNNIVLVKNDYVIVNTELGKEIGKVVGFYNIDDDDTKQDDTISKEAKKLKSEKTTDDAKILKSIIRKAISEDLKKIPNQNKKNKALENCKKFITKHGLPIKLVDVHFAFDNSIITFAFIADGRVDFRELVKDLISNFNCAIRLHQIGKKDEAMLAGDYGPCGRALCCKSLNNFPSITSGMAELQQVSHRGSVRASGMCGRLMCCLSYENESYKKLAEKMPAMGTKIDVEGKKGTVVGHNVLMQTVDVKFLGAKKEDKTVIKIAIKDL